jgi:hypothetical protein
MSKFRPIFLGKNKDQDADQENKQQQGNKQLSEREARRQQQAALDERLRLYRQRKLDLRRKQLAFRRKREEERRYIRSTFLKLRAK